MWWILEEKRQSLDDKPYQEYQEEAISFFTESTKGSNFVTVGCYWISHPFLDAAFMFGSLVSSENERDVGKRMGDWAEVAQLGKRWTKHKLELYTLF